MAKKQVNRIDPMNDPEDEKADQIERRLKSKYRNSDPRKQSPKNAIHKTEDRRKGKGI